MYFEVCIMNLKSRMSLQRFRTIFHQFLCVLLIKCRIANFKFHFYWSQAGIDTKMLTIALEPEAAALYVKHLPIEKRVDGKEGDVFQTFSPGSKYIVVDAGGL